jgi:Uma2 family endonuclease
LARGVEADACYYVRNTKRIIGKSRLDLKSDPPPDIAVEIDTTSDSGREFPIYAGLGVPELWIYDKQRVHMYKLTGHKYVAIPQSRFLPGLTGALLAEGLELSKTDGQTTALKAFRKRVEGI